MQRGNECGQERFEELDKKGFHRCQEIIDVCELENALPRNLRKLELSVGQ